MCEYEQILRNGTLAQLQGLDSATLSQITSDGDSALHVAVACNNVQAMEYILSKRPNLVFCLNAKKQSVLHIAVQARNGYILSQLICRYPKLSNVIDVNDKTALLCAIETGYLEGVMIILHYNPSAMEDRNLGGDTLLHLALDCRQFGIARFLIAILPLRLIVAQGVGKHTALHIAVIVETSELVALLCDVCPASIHMLNFDGQSPFLIAADYSDVERMQLFLARDPSVVDQKDDMGNNVLHLCAKKEIVELVVAIKPQLLDGLTKDGSSVLHTASENDCLFLLKQKPSLLYVKNNNGETALDASFILGEYGKVNVILRFKPNIIDSDFEENTVLHMAVRAGDNEVIALVFSNCMSNLHKTNKYGQTPFDIAFEKKHSFAITLFQQHLTCEQVSCDVSLRPLFLEQCCQLEQQLHPPLIGIILNFIDF